MKPHKGTTLVLFFLLIVTVIDCGGSGRIISAPEENPNINLELIAAEPLLEQLCEKVSSCLTGITKETCLIEGRASTLLPATLLASYDDPVFLPTPGEATVYTYQDLIEDETIGTIQAKSLAYNRCAPALESVQCEVVEDIYWEELPLEETLAATLDYTTHCPAVFSRTEQDDTCEAGGAQARWFSSGCADHCGTSSVCTMALAYDCDCGAGYCWNGSNCEEN